MQKIVVISWHGLGDNILLTPVLREFQKQQDAVIALTYLERLPVPALLSECPYIKEFIPVADPWNEFVNVDIGRQAIYKQVIEWAEKHEYNQVVEVTMSPHIATHKMLRAAKELGITLPDYKTEIFPSITKKVRKAATKYFDILEEPYVFVHRKAGNPPKDIPPDIVKSMLDRKGYKYYNTIEYGSRTLPARYLPIGNIPLEMEVLRRCSEVVCADSFIMHAATSLGIPTAAIFVTTPPTWVIPLYDCPFEIHLLR